MAISQFSMNVGEWYTVTLAAIVIGMLISQARRVDVRVRFPFLKHVVYPLLVERRSWGSITRLQAVFIATFFLSNLAMVIGVRCVSEFSKRSGVMACINLIPLYVGGHTSLPAHLLGFSFQSYYLAHHWIGRVAILQALIHAVLMTTLERQAGDLSLGIPLMVVLSMLLLSSLPLIRRLWYEWFQKGHFILAIAAIILLTIHLSTKSGSTFYPIIALVLWASHILQQICYTFMHGWEKDATVTTFDGQRTILKVTLREPIAVKPGYIYLRFPGLGLRSKLQAHPFAITSWDYEGNVVGNTKMTSLYFLIQPSSRLTTRLVSKSKLKVSLLGRPFGRDLGLVRYETVILFAEGIGIAGILPYVQYLADRRHHDDKVKRAQQLARKKQNLEREIRNISDLQRQFSWVSTEDMHKRLSEVNDVLKRVQDEQDQLYQAGYHPQLPLYRDTSRRVDLRWKLHENSLEDWVLSRLQKLQHGERAEKKFLYINCYYPQQKLKEPAFVTNEAWRCLYKRSYTPEDYLEVNSSSPGRQIAVTCGTPNFVQSVRKAVLKKMSQQNIIEFAELEFQPTSTTQYKRPTTLKQPDIELGIFGHINSNLPSNPNSTIKRTTTQVAQPGEPPRSYGSHGQAIRGQWTKLADETKKVIKKPSRQGQDAGFFCEYPPTRHVGRSKVDVDNAQVTVITKARRQQICEAGRKTEVADFL